MNGTQNYHVVYNLQQGLRVGKLFRNGFLDSDIMSLFVVKHGRGDCQVGKRGWGFEGGGDEGREGTGKIFLF